MGDNSTLLSIDLLVLVDFALYQRFLEKARGDAYSAEAAVHQYFTSVLHEVRPVLSPASTTREARQVERIYAGVATAHFRFRLWPAGVVLAKVGAWE